MSASPPRLLAVFAHPDDEILCGAGTLALWAAHGGEVTLLCATRGELGPIADPSLATPENLAQVREHELRVSCEALGLAPPVFLDLPDAGVDWAAESAGTLPALVQWIRRLRPEVILTFGPDGLYGHSDHVAIGELTTQAHALAAASVQLSDRAGGALPAGASLASPHLGGRLFYPVIPADAVARLLEGARRAGIPASLWRLGPEHFQVPRAEITCSVDVTSVLPRKLAALRAHRTQLEHDNVLAHLTPQLAAAFFGEEHFRSADGGPGELLPRAAGRAAPLKAGEPSAAECPAPKPR